jgi:hypothetical protein
MVERLYNDYSYLGLSVDDIYVIIAIHPNLSETQLRTLLDRYLDVVSENPNLVGQYGALAVFEEFIALSAYDPAHGGDYAIRKPCKARDLRKGIEEAIAELGVMEVGRVPWPMTPSTNPKYEGTDPSGQKWDVKSPQSVTLDGKVFDVEEVLTGMQKDFNLGENIILDDRSITIKEIRELYRRLKASGQGGRVVWWPTDPNP